MLKAAMAIGTSDEVPDVLAHCPYHNQIIVARAARDTYFENQGLLDFQEFTVRNEIIAK